MLADVIKIFEKEYEKYGDKYITDSHIPDDGGYIIVEEKDDGFQIIDEMEIKMDKETRQVNESGENYDFICQADYLSKYLSSNKSVKNKNIHSNNYLAFFIKKENVHNGKMTEEIIQEYYSVLKNPLLKYTKKSSKLLYQIIEEKYGPPDIERINKIEEWVIDNLFNLVDENSRDKSHLKIFFKYDLELYRKESERYVLVNLYNSNDYNLKINGEVYGLHNNNMGLNAKKPYLENKTRKNTSPYLISEKEVLMQKRFFDYLANKASANKTNIYLNDKEGINGFTNEEIMNKNFSGYFMRIRKRMEIEIHDFDIVGFYSPKIRAVNLENVLQNENTRIHYGEIHGLGKLKSTINEVFFNKFLSSNFFTEAKDLKINDNALKRNILLSRTALFNWFYKGNDQGVWKVLNFSSSDLIKGSINKGYLLKATEQFNLRCALKAYFEGGESVADIIMDIKNSLREKINKDNTDCITNDKEYYFAVGQLTNYLISLSKTRHKTHSLSNPIINSKTDKKIKEQLKQLYKKYNYVMNANSKRFKNLYAMVASYVPNEKVNEDLIIAGYLHSNLIYETTKNKEVNEDE